MNTKLSDKKCQPCEGIGNAYTNEQAQTKLSEVSDWSLTNDGKAIIKDYLTKNFMAAITFINKVAEVAEADDHHPDIHLVGYRNLRIELSTHAIGGLSENDFIVAAKIDELPVELKTR